MGVACSEKLAVLHHQQVPVPEMPVPEMPVPADALPRYAVTVPRELPCTGATDHSH